MTGGFWSFTHSDVAAVLSLRVGVDGQELGITDLRVLLALMSKTQGFGRDRDIVTAGQIAKMTGVARPHVHDALTRLEKAGLVGSKEIAPRVVERWVEWGRIRAHGPDLGTSPSRGTSPDLGIVPGVVPRDGHSKTHRIITPPTPQRGQAPEELQGLPLYASDSKLIGEWPKLLASWQVAFPDVDIASEIAKAHAWEVSNPQKRKRDRARFLHSWLSRAAKDRPDAPKVEGKARAY